MARVQNCPDLTILNSHFLHNDKSWSSSMNNAHGLGLHQGISHGVDHGVGIELPGQLKSNKMLVLV